MLKNIHRSRIKIIAVGLLLTLAAAAFSVWRPLLLQEVDLRVYDHLLATSAVSEQRMPVVVVEIDDDSLQRYGQWPWPRSLVALLLGRVLQGGPRAVGVDILFAEPDSHRAEDLPPSLQRQLAALLQGSLVRSPDEALAEMLRRGPFVLGFKFRFEPPAASVASPVPYPLDLGASLPALFQPTRTLTPLDILVEQVSAIGFLNAGVDRDGVFRRIPLLMAYAGQVYPSLALATLHRGQAAPISLLRDRRGDQVLLWDGRRIPIDEHGNFLINFPQVRHSLQRISAAEILDGAVAIGFLHDKVVFLGVSATGLDSRLISSLGDSFKGVDVHAQVAANVLQGGFLQSPGWRPGAEVLLLAVVGLVLPLVLAWVPPLFGTVISVLSAWGLWAGTGALLQFQGWYLSPLMPLLLLCVVFPMVALMRFRYQERHAEEQEEQAEFMQNFMMQSLCSLASIRDSETGEHILRTQKYLKLLAEELHADPAFSKELTPETVDLLYRLASLHDIGKVGVPDVLLLKPGRLTAAEFEEIKKHTIYGRQVIVDAEERAGVCGTRALQLAKDIVYSHHEWWNGGGYPEGLMRTEIPLAGRLMAVVDVYDALVSRRIYKPPVSHDDAVAIIRERSGVQFDPAVIEGFLRVETRWRQIHDNFHNDPPRGAVPSVPGGSMHG